MQRSIFHIQLHSGKWLKPGSQRNRRTSDFLCMSISYSYHSQLQATIWVTEQAVRKSCLQFAFVRQCEPAPAHPIYYNGNLNITFKWYMLVMYMKQWELVSTDVVLSLILPLTNTVTSEKNCSLNFSSPLKKWGQYAAFLEGSQKKFREC